MEKVCKRPGALAQEGETCEGWNESTAEPFPSCDEGLVCEDLTGVFTDPGMEKVCKRPGALAQEGDICDGYNYITGSPFPKCDEGLVCKPGDFYAIPGAENICKKPTGVKVERVTGQDQCEPGTVFDQRACACFETA